MSDDRWIVIPNWPRFQHYGNRSPAWIKVYLELLSKPEFVDLTWAAQGLLLNVWLRYALSRGQVRCKDLSKGASKSSLRHFQDTIALLNHAGFIEFSASKPLALRYRNTRSRREVSKETSKERASSGAIASAAAASPQEEEEPALAESELAELERQLPDALQRQQPPADDVERDPQALERLRQLMSDLNYTNERSQM